jgi:hypothetical protein
VRSSRGRNLRPVSLEHDFTISLGLSHADMGLTPLIGSCVKDPRIIITDAGTLETSEEDNFLVVYDCGVIGAGLRLSARAFYLRPVKLGRRYIKLVQFTIGTRRAT